MNFQLQRKMMEDRESDLGGWNSLVSLGQDLMDRQGGELSSPLVLASAGWLAILTFQLLLPLLAPLLSSGLSSSFLKRHSVPLLPPLSLSGFPAVALTREEFIFNEWLCKKIYPFCQFDSGGTVLITASALAGQSLLPNPMLGEK